jgi:hypothetical protein
VIDYWKLTKEYSQGDAVQKINVSTGQLSPYVGSVTAVHRGIGCLDVQWPFGNERVFPDDVVRVSPDFLRFLPPAFDQSYVTVEIEKARKASAPLWRNAQFQPSVYIDLARHWHKGAGEVIAYDDLYRTLSPNVDDEALRDEVGKFYRLARNAGELRIQQAIQKSGAYWVAQNRQYRATGEDLKVGKPTCPKCGSRMRKATYKMNKGAKHSVFACPKCLYLIDPPSILGPTGEPHDWFKVGPAVAPVPAVVSQRGAR